MLNVVATGVDRTVVVDDDVLRTVVAVAFGVEVEVVELEVLLIIAELDTVDV